MSDAIREMDATGQAELVSSGEVSPRELVDIAINRAKEVNPEVNAIIAPLYEEAVTASEGELPEGPFQGVPFIFKDLGAGLQGQPFHMGNRLLKERDFRVPFDTTLGARFREAGLVTIGRSNTPEFGILPTTEPVAYGASKGGIIAFTKNAALELAKTLDKGSVVLAMLPDTGERYLSTFLFEGINEGSDEDWLATL